MRLISPSASALSHLALLSSRSTLAFTIRLSSEPPPAADLGIGASKSPSVTDPTAASEPMAFVQTRASALIPVPVTEETVEFTSGLVGGAVGLAVGGPVLGAVSAAVANYVSKKDEESGEVVRAVARSAVECYNYLAELDAKYEIVERGRRSLESLLDWIKSNEKVDAEAVKKIERLLADTAASLQELNDEYDFVGAGLNTLDAVGDLVEALVRKIDEVNKEFKVSDRATSAIREGIEATKSKQ